MSRLCLPQKTSHASCCWTKLSACCVKLYRPSDAVKLLIWFSGAAEASPASNKEAPDSHVVQAGAFVLQYWKPALPDGHWGFPKALQGQKPNFGDTAEACTSDVLESVARGTWVEHGMDSSVQQSNLHGVGQVHVLETRPCMQWKGPSSEIRIFARSKGGPARPQLPVTVRPIP